MLNKEQLEKILGLTSQIHNFYLKNLPKLGSESAPRFLCLKENIESFQESVENFKEITQENDEFTKEEKQQLEQISTMILQQVKTYVNIFSSAFCSRSDF